jgi:hypothetical protein
MRMRRARLGLGGGARTPDARSPGARIAAPSGAGECSRRAGLSLGKTRGLGPESATGPTAEWQALRRRSPPVGSGRRRDRRGAIISPSVPGTGAAASPSPGGRCSGRCRSSPPGGKAAIALGTAVGIGFRTTGLLTREPDGTLSYEYDGIKG